MQQLLVLGQVSLAMILGAVVGLNREFSKKPAGLRTHMLVAGAAALIVRLSEIAFIHFSSFVDSNILQLDPTRIFVAVVTGISFLGAGTIIRHGIGGKVEGLTTAASLLFCAVIGMGVAYSRYILSIGASLISVIVLWTIAKVENMIRKRTQSDNGNKI
jgi:putative Mg2+ transporter-C (MgtC) family protein